MNTEQINLQMFSEKISREMDTGKNGVSTLLIPEGLIKDFKRNSKRFKSIGDYFSHLISVYRIPLKTFANDPRGLKKQYQNMNLSLIKINFRPMNQDWAELGTFSIACGRSRCLLFVILLMMDIGGWANSLKMIGIPKDYPFSDRLQWEFLSTFGVDKIKNTCKREFSAIMKESESKPGTS